MRTFKTLPLVTHVYDVPIGVIPFLLIMNKDTWSKLSPRAQEAVMKHGGVSMAEVGGKAYDDLADKIRDDALADGNIEVVAVTDEQKNAYAEQAQGVHTWWIEKTNNGQEIYDIMQNVLRDTQVQ